MRNSLPGQILLHGSLPFQDAAEAERWLRRFPLGIAVRPQLPLSGPGTDMIGEVHEQCEKIVCTAATLALKDQLVGPVTYLEVKNCEGTVESDILTLQSALKRHIAELSNSSLPRLFVLDEPAVLLSRSTLKEADCARLIERFLELIRHSGCIPGVHCCQNPMSLAVKAVFESLSAELFSLTFVPDHEDLLASLYRQQKLVCLGLTVGLLEQGPQAFAARMKAMAAHATLEVDQILAQTLLSPECGLGLLSLEESEAILLRLCEFQTYLFSERGLSKTS